jgi:hypothetical protein
LTAVNKLDQLPSLFKHILTTVPTDEASFHETNMRIKDVLFKQTILVGIVRVVLAITSLAKVEKNLGRPVQPISVQESGSTYIRRDSTLPRSVIIDVGRNSLNQLYRHNLEDIMATWGNHRADMEWLQERVIYGMFIGDNVENGEGATEEAKHEEAERPFAPLKQVEVSMVTVASIMPQVSGPGPSGWHVRGLMRLGIRLEEAEKLCDAVKLVGKWAGTQGTEAWMSAKDVVDEV